jgi:hypothetical protein
MEVDRSCYWAPGRTCDYELNENENFVFIVATSEVRRDGERTLLDIITDSVRKCSFKDEQLEPIFAQFENISGFDIFCSKICGYIKRSGLVIVDLTPRKQPSCALKKCKDISNYPSPNVYWEYGFASGLKKKIITICDKDQIEKLPFDIQGIGYIEYKKEEIKSFEDLLSNNIKEKLQEVIQFPKKKKEEKRKRLIQNIKDWLEPFIGNFRAILDNNYKEYREFFSYLFPYVICKFFKIEQDNISKTLIYLSKSNSSRDLVTPHLINFNDIRDDPSSTIDRMNDDDFERILTSKGFLGDVDTNSPDKRYDIRITLPSNFLKIKPKLIIENEIKRVIFRKFNESRVNNLIRKSVNRLSLITEEDINKISDFLGLLELSSNVRFEEQEMKELANVNNEIFEKIFFYLGFEVIPLELLKRKKILESRNILYPNLIIYDLDSNYIILLEEQLGFTKKEEREIKHKVYATRETLGKFRTFFPKENRKVNFVYIGPKISIEQMYMDKHMKEHMGEYIWVSSDDFIKHSRNIFNKNIILNKDIFKKPLFENFDFKDSLQNCIQLIKR